MQRWTAYRVQGVDPLPAEVVLTVVAYVLVVGTFLDLLPIYPTLTPETIDLLTHAIAAANAVTVGAIATGWIAIRRGRVRLHASAMILALATILAFLAMYLLRIGGGGYKEIVGPEGLVLLAYYAMLFVHIALSVLAVPLVIFVAMLAVSRPIDQLYDTNHARIGRIAAGTWLVSLVLGLVTYLMLNHVYAGELVITA